MFIFAASVDTRAVLAAQEDAGILPATPGEPGRTGDRGRCETAYQGTGRP